MLGSGDLPENAAFRLALAVELVLIDLEHRWRRWAEHQRAGECSSERPPRLADYAARLPEVGPLERLPDDVLAEEYRVRQLWGDRPHCAEYLRHFGPTRPGLKAALDRIDREIKVQVPTTDGTAPVAPSEDLKRRSPSGTAAVTETERGGYRVIQPFTEGGMGRLSIAEDRALRRQVLIKEIKKDYAEQSGARERFVAEARIAGQLEHPGVVPVYTFGVDRHGQPFYAMRHIQGQTLDTAIKQHRAQPSPRGLKELLRRFVAICQTVAYAHARGVIHRDLKPTNVMLGAFGEIVVLDWGLAKPVADGGSPDSTMGDVAAHERARQYELTASGSKVGSPPYMAPE